MNDETTQTIDVGAGAAFTNPAFSFAGETYPGTGGTASSQIGPWESGTIVVSFAPTTVGNFSETLQIPYDGSANRVADFQLSGVSVSPASESITNLSTLYFEKNGGAATDATFTITNSGGYSATNIAAATAGLVYPGQYGTASVTAAAGASATMAAEFYTGNGPLTFPSSLGLSYNNGLVNTSVSVPTSGLQIVVTGGELDVTTPAELTSVVVSGGLAVLSDKNALASGASLTVGAGTSAFGAVTPSHSAGSVAAPAGAAAIDPATQAAGGVSAVRYSVGTQGAAPALHAVDAALALDLL